MSAAVRGRLPSARQAVDAVVYALSVVAVLAAVSATVAVARYLLLPGGRTGRGVVYDLVLRTSDGLFVLALLVFGVAAWKLRPAPAWKDRDEERRPSTAGPGSDGDAGGATDGDGGGSRDVHDVDGEAWFAATTRRLVPAAYRPAPDERLRVGWRLLLAGVGAFAASVLVTLPFLAG